jgi:hypothetical protein
VGQSDASVQQCRFGLDALSAHCVHELGVSCLGAEYHRAATGLAWTQVRVISSSIFLWLYAGGGFGKSNLDVQALVLLFIRHMWLIAKDRVPAKRCAYACPVHYA